MVMSPLLLLRLGMGIAAEGGVQACFREPPLERRVDLCVFAGTPPRVDVNPMQTCRRHSAHVILTCPPGAAEKRPVTRLSQAGVPKSGERSVWPSCHCA